MSNRNRQLMHPKKLLTKRAQFSFFTEQELDKLCVLKIITDETFDNLGHPKEGGLYDRRLGPLRDNQETCGSCQKTNQECLGHYGYIDIPLPLTNPLFHRFCYMLLRRTCLNCFCLQFPTYIKHSFILQMKLLEKGYVAEALEVETLTLEYDKKEALKTDLTERFATFENILENDTNVQKTKNTEALHLQFLDHLFKLKMIYVCIYCKSQVPKITSLNKKLILEQTVLENNVKVKNKHFIAPDQSMDYLRKLWEKENELLRFIFPVLNEMNSEYPTDAFFFNKKIIVPPPNTRPVNFIKDMISEHPTTKLYKSILQNSNILKVAVRVVQLEGDTKTLTINARDLYNYIPGGSAIEKMNSSWDTLQRDVNCLIEANQKISEFSGGIKELIEKKHGIIRQHMMGKRVDFAARSVIAPDPNLNIDEIGIPEIFAKTLTYPVPVTPWNVEEVRKWVMNGPDVYPGANKIEYENGMIMRLSKNETQREAVMKSLLTPGEKFQYFKGAKVVYRHLQTGDVMLLNRQPTLHKPSIMAHTTRILKEEKTLRLHYANCKAYNADFDGDEMNAHFPQNELCRSEAYIIANVGNQYLVPKDGTPLSGLIQDHVISGVALSVRGKFFNETDYQQLVYQALGYKPLHVKLLPPSIIKPQRLWSGKQVLSTVIINSTPDGKELINLTATAKIPAKAWISQKPRPWKAGGTAFKYDNCMTEGEVIIRQGELLVGVLDKTHYGATPYGLVHCMYELYGGNCAIRLLSSFAKLFTYNLQHRGFTLGALDILVTETADKERNKIIKKCRKVGIQAITKAVNLPENSTVKEIVEKIRENSAVNPNFRAIIDREYKSALDSFTNDINKACIPAGLVSKFPTNNLQLMVMSGAKGSTVNTMQISSLLGQIELEGKRPPIMISSKALPSFPEYEFAPRAGGYIDARFMTGIANQEFFYHCMAGREGLIDTAVKTSRSGYLQRCLIKHLEGLKVGYDMTVRDSDGSVVQFKYGEDGMDILKAQFLNKKQMSILKDNVKAILDKKALKLLKSDEDDSKVDEHQTKIENWMKNFGNPLEKKRMSPFAAFSQVTSQEMKDNLNESKSLKLDKITGRVRRTKKIIEMWRNLDESTKNMYMEVCKNCPNPTSDDFQPDVCFGSLNERLIKIMKETEVAHPEAKIRKKERRDFENMFKLKSMQSLAAPGEPVGLLAAQSIGEPSTQMTLNTFHFAGRGEMNVTLGIPRLREILMMASKNIKTPSMEIPFLNVPDLEKKAEKLRKSFTKVVVADVLESVDVEVDCNDDNLSMEMVYTLKFKFLPQECYAYQYCVKPKYILKKVGEDFIKKLVNAIRKNCQIKTTKIVEDKENSRKRKRGDEEDEDLEYDNNLNDSKRVGDESSDSESDIDEDDAKQTNKRTEVLNGQEPEDDDDEAGKSENSDDELDEPVKAKKLKVEENGGGDKSDEDEATDDKVLAAHHFISRYVYDKKKHLWCEITFSLPPSQKTLDLTSIVQEVAEKSVLWEIPQLKRAITYTKDDKLFLRTDGINIGIMYKYADLLDLNKLYSNDIHRIAETYGIEAAVKAIVKEVTDVFKVYGITVDPRHLSLIADYMTFNGIYEPLNRKGMECSASPFQQISFESALTFLKDSLFKGKKDRLQNPSSSLFVGKPVSSGTGSFQLYAKLTQ